MGKKYNWAGALQSQYLKVTDSTPLDDRSVVESRNDLLNENTWVVENTRCTYSGMIAAVVDDLIEDNNGVYYLRRSSKYNKQAWDSTLENYNIEGWRKLSSGSGGNLSNILWITFTKSTHTNGPITCSATYSEITTAINSGYLVIGMYQPNIQGYYKQYFTIPTNINTDTLLFANQSPNDANEVLFITMTAQETTLTITKDYAIPDVANNDGKVLTADSSNDQVVWTSLPSSTQVQTDWEEQDSSNVSFLENMPDAFRNPPDAMDIYDGMVIENAVQDVDGNWYNAVVINDQLWLKENLRVTHNSDGSDFYDYFGNNNTYLYPENNSNLVNDYGLLYNKYTVIDFINSGKSLAPEGWSIPSATQIEDLLAYIGTKPNYIQNNNSNYIAKSLSSKETWDDSNVSYTPGNNQITNNATNMSFVSAGSIHVNINGTITSTIPTGTNCMLHTTDYNNATAKGKTLLIMYNNPSVICAEANDINVYYASVRCVCNVSASQWLNNNRERLYLKLTPNGMVWSRMSIVSETGSYNDLTDKPSIPVVPTIRTMNHEQLTDSSLGDINIHDGYYFPNAVQDYDGNWYGAVVIGDQVWLAENIKTTHMPDGTPIINGSASANSGTAIGDNSNPYYYWVNDDETTKDSYGLLYNVNSIMDNENASTTNPSGVQGISPDGWHIPSDSEYQQLLDYVTAQKRFDYPNHPESGYSYYTNALTRDDYNSGVIGGTADKINATGFSANGQLLPNSSVILFPTSDGYNLGSSTFYSEEITCIAFYEGIGFDTTEGVEIGLYNGCLGLNVRCVSDLKPIQFRNWYTKTYGTMQHHLMDDEEEVFWCHFTRANKVITQMDKTIDEIYQAYTEGKLIMCESFAANDSQFYSLVSCSQNNIVFGCALSQEATTASRFHFVIGTKVSNVDTWVDDYSEYQAKLISGVTIKTINGNSILGNGNLSIQAVPTPTSADEGKLLSVDSNGGYELITIVNSENIEY